MRKLSWIVVAIAASVAAPSAASAMPSYACVQTDDIKFGRPVERRLVAGEGGQYKVVTRGASEETMVTFSATREPRSRLVLRRKTESSQSEWGVPEAGGRSSFKFIKFSPDGDIWIASTAYFDCQPIRGSWASPAEAVSPHQ